MHVVNCPKPRSARLPARAAPNAPATPARPNAPIAVCDRLYGVVLRGSTSEVHSVPNTTKIRKPSTPRIRRIRSCLNNINKEAFHTLFAELVEEEYGHGPSKGCFCINTIVELAPHEEKFEILTREHQMYLSVIFEEKIVQGIRSGELESSLNAKALAQALVVSFIGLTVLMKSRPERSFVDHSVATILSILK